MVFPPHLLQISEERYWDEISAAERLKEYRAQQQGFMGISFSTISAFAENGAVIHYKPVSDTNKQIMNTSLYLLDSGGHYKGERRTNKHLLRYYFGPKTKIAVFRSS